MKKKEDKTLLLNFIVFLLILLFFLSILPVKYAFAEELNTSEEQIYTDVLYDLNQSDTFNIGDYPVRFKSYKLEVITLGEGSNGELFVYVYQPSGQNKNLQATSINLSSLNNANVKDLNSNNGNNYKLKHINSNGVFFKYVVVGFTNLKDNEKRCYTVFSIYRAFDAELGDKEVEGQTITEVVYPVSAKWTFETSLEGNITVSKEEVNVVTITDKFVGFVRYENGWTFFNNDKMCDSHFVAFSCDYDIEQLFEAEVLYYTQKYEYGTEGMLSSPYSKYGEKQCKKVTLSYEDDEVTFKGNGWKPPSYKWNTIQTVEDFKKSVNVKQTVYSGMLFNVTVGSKINAKDEEKLNSLSWVLRFEATEFYHCKYSEGGQMTYRQNEDNRGTMVGDVTIFRLKFLNQGTVYNLGVIDNKVTGESTPINTTERKIELNSRGKIFFKILKIIIIVLICIVVLFLIAPILPYFFKVVFFPFKLLFKAIKRLFKKE